MALNRSIFTLICGTTLSLFTASAQAQVTESEPNNTFATRNFFSDTTTVSGELSTVISGDVDFFELSSLEPNSGYVAEVTFGEFDSVLGVFADDGSLIELDDDGGDGPLSQIVGVILDSSNLRFAVTGFPDFDFEGNHSESGSYTLSFDTFPASPTRPNSRLVNNGFETGDFTGWTTVGQTSVENFIFSSSRGTEGLFQALLTTGEDAVADSRLETFLGLDVGSLDELGNGIATVGSAIRQSFSAQAGDLLTFDFNFLTNEATPDFFNDFAFVSVISLSELADTNSQFMSSLSPFSEETGFGTFSFTVPTSGDYVLGLGVTDVEDEVVDSGLLIDNVQLTSVPEPSALLSLIMFSIGAGCLPKRQQKQGAKHN